MVTSRYRRRSRSRMSGKLSDRPIWTRLRLAAIMLGIYEFATHREADKGGGRMPQSIMLIRHGEKPERDGPALGIDENGKEDKNELIVRGWQRAGALARFFLPARPSPANPRISTPTSLFAAMPNAAEPSKRSLHTLGPLSALSGVKINASCGVGEEEKLADRILKEDGVVLVAWEHKHIKDIVKFLTNDAVTSPHWPGDRFDMVFVVTPSPKAGLVQVPQLLLAGDSKQEFAI